MKSISGREIVRTLLNGNCMKFKEVPYDNDTHRLATWNDVTAELGDTDSANICNVEFRCAAGDIVQVFITAYDDKENKIMPAVEYWIDRKDMPDIIIPIAKAPVCHGCFTMKSKKEKDTGV